MSSSPEVRFILDRFPVAAPFQPKIAPEYADRFVLRRFVQILRALEHADIEGYAEVVVRITTACIRHETARLTAPLRIQVVLLVVGSQTAEYFDYDSRSCGFAD